MRCANPEWANEARTKPPGMRGGTFRYCSKRCVTRASYLRGGEELKELARLNMARRRAKDAEKSAAYQKKWREKHAAQVRVHAGKAFRKAYDSPESRMRVMLGAAKTRANIRPSLHGMVHDATIADLLPLPVVCPVLGVELSYRAKGGIHTPNSASIDRIDPSRGYCKGNVWVISMRANVVKNDGTPEEHEQIAKAVRERMSPAPKSRINLLRLVAA